MSVRIKDGALLIDVVDDGRGGALANGSGSGLPGLRDRLDVLGATLAVTNGHTGTRLRATLPCG